MLPSVEPMERHRYTWGLSTDSSREKVSGFLPSGGRGHFPQAGVALSVGAGVVGVEVDEAALDLEVPDLEHVALAARRPIGDIGSPRTVPVLAVARAFGDQGVRAREDPVTDLSQDC